MQVDPFQYAPHLKKGPQFFSVGNLSTTIGISAAVIWEAIIAEKIQPAFVLNDIMFFDGAAHDTIKCHAINVGAIERMEIRTAPVPAELIIH